MSPEAKILRIDTPMSEGYRALIQRAAIGPGNISSTALVGRSQLADWNGITFRGARDLYKALGYSRVLLPLDYRWRYDRGGIAARLVEAKPQATWLNGAEIIEDDNPDVMTEFETAWDALATDMNIWSEFETLDNLAGLGRFAVMLLGAPGDMLDPIPNLGPDGLLYVRSYSERDATVLEIDIDTASPRFGKPVKYSLTRIVAPLQGIAASQPRMVHFSRLLHVADGKLDDAVYGEPRLKRIWNYLDDLDKVIGGGAEAFWKRVDAGLWLKQDPAIGDMSPEAKKAFDDQLEEFTNGLRRIMRTRGIDAQVLDATTSDLGGPMKALMTLLATACGIPQRILMGSERGELASTQDADEWSERIDQRRGSYASIQFVKPFIDQMITLGRLPKPTQYAVKWPDSSSTTDAERLGLGLKAAQMNQAMGESVVTINEIRDKYLQLPALSPDQEQAIASAMPQGQKLATPEQRVAKWSVMSEASQRRYIANMRTIAETAAEDKGKFKSLLAKLLHRGE